jgi:hypothetical protein
MNKIEQMRSKFANMTDKGIQLVLEGVMTKREKADVKALVFAVGLSELNKKNPSLCEYVFAEIKLMKYAEKVIAGMQKINIAA